MSERTLNNQTVFIAVFVFVLIDWSIYFFQNFDDDKNDDIVVKKQRHIFNGKQRHPCFDVFKQVEIQFRE